MTAPRKRDRRNEYNPLRDQGCIVTVRLPDGSQRVRHSSGAVLEALAVIVAKLPEGSTVESISTPATILRDLRWPPRRTGGRRQSPQTEPYSVEATLLGKIGRPDLLPVRATGSTNGRVQPRRRPRPGGA